MALFPTFVPTVANFSDIVYDYEHPGYIPSLGSTFYPGECLQLVEITKIEGTPFLSRHVRILQMPPVVTIDGKTAISVSWLVPLVQACNFSGERYSTRKTNTPRDRTYLEYPDEFVETNIIQLVLLDQICSETYAFHPLDVDTGSTYHALGMDNFIVVSYRFTYVSLESSTTSTPALSGTQSNADVTTSTSTTAGSTSTTSSFTPLDVSLFYQLSEDSYTRNSFAFYSALGMIITKALHSVQKVSTFTYKMYCNPRAWKSLKNRLHGKIPLHSKFKSTITYILHRNYGTKESIRKHYTMECFRANTQESLRALSSVFGSGIMCGVCSTPTPIREPIRSKDNGFLCSSTKCYEDDVVKGYIWVPSSSQFRQPRKFRVRSSDERIDLLYNPVLFCLTLRLQVQHGNMSMSGVKKIFGIVDRKPIIEVHSSDSEEEDPLNKSCHSVTPLSEGDQFVCDNIYFRIKDLQPSRGMYTVCSTVIQAKTAKSRNPGGHFLEFEASIITSTENPTSTASSALYAPLGSISTSSSTLLHPGRGDTVYWKDDDAQYLVRNYV